MQEMCQFKCTNNKFLYITDNQVIINMYTKINSGIGFKMINLMLHIDNEYAQGLTNLRVMISSPALTLSRYIPEGYEATLMFSCTCDTVPRFLD